jgi:tRNA-(ms[2]io[6]A)-hydroxylase
MLMLRVKSPKEWVEAVLSDFNLFLLDHAACERKASATALTLVCHYPDRSKLVRAMIDLAREELEHFHQVYLQIESRGLQLASDYKDRYVLGLRQQIRAGRQNYLLDQLLVASVVEARGCERFGLLAEALDAGPLKDLYVTFSRSEARHHRLFLRLARSYFEHDQVSRRLEELLELEAKIVTQLPMRAALH